MESKNNTVTVVMSRGSDGSLELFGLFTDQKLAHHRILSDCGRFKIFHPEEYEELLGDLCTDQGWEIVVVDSGNNHPTIEDVWGYIITDTVQTERT